MKEPLVSIIMGTFNPEIHSFVKAIDSIIKQTYVNWELIICDDGSDEVIFEQISNIVDGNERIICIRNNFNRGLAYALNKCLNYTHGKYIARMDDDDISKDNRIQRQLEFLENNEKYSWVGCQGELFDNTGVWGVAQRVECPAKKDFLLYSPYIHSSVMFRKKILVFEGGYSVKNVTARCEDYELFMRLTAKGYFGYNLPDILLSYREESKMLKRRLRYCWYEMLVRIQGFSRLGLMNVHNLPYVLKPIAVYLASLFPKTAQNVRVNRKYGNHMIRK